MHDLVNGLRIDLTKYRRGTDQRHFQSMVSLYDRSWPLEECVAAARARYPRTDKAPQYVLVMAHKTRMRENRRINERLARERSDAVLLKAAHLPKGAMSNMPQDMWLWAGLKLQSCVKDSNENPNVTNGFEYEVMRVTAHKMKLRKLHPSGDNVRHPPGSSFELPHGETALNMRLQHALCYYTAQGRTMRDGLVVMTDTNHRTFSRRDLITGSGRVGEGRDMEVV